MCAKANLLSGFVLALSTQDMYIPRLICDCVFRSFMSLVRWLSKVMTWNAWDVQLMPRKVLSSTVIAAAAV